MPKVETFHLTPEQFLEPWQSRMYSFTAAGGTGKMPQVQKDSPLYQAAKEVLEYLPLNSPTPAQTAGVLQNLDWMVDTLAGEQREKEKCDGRAAARLAEAFWSSPSGKAVVTIYHKCLGDGLVSPTEAGHQLHISPQIIFQYVYQKRIPAYPSISVRRRKIRLDHAKAAWAEENDKKNP